MQKGRSKLLRPLSNLHLFSRRWPAKALTLSEMSPTAEQALREVGEAQSYIGVYPIAGFANSNYRYIEI